MSDSSGRNAGLAGSSDDLQHVWVEGQRLGCGEYTDKRLVLTLPDGQQMTATLEYDSGWEVNFDIPEGVQVQAEERHYGREWTAIEGQRHD